MIRKARAEGAGPAATAPEIFRPIRACSPSRPIPSKTRFQGEKGTNPEELIAAAHAGCFTMALAFQLQTAGFTPTSLSTEAAVSLDQEGAGFKISKSALTWWPRCRGSTRQPRQARRGGEKGCPVSKVLNAEITLTKTLK